MGEQNASGDILMYYSNYPCKYIIEIRERGVRQSKWSCTNLNMTQKYNYMSAFSYQYDSWDNLVLF